jgi:hypothetical protein
MGETSLLAQSRGTLPALQGDRLPEVLGGTAADTDTCSGTCIDISRCNRSKDTAPPPP